MINFLIGLVVITGILGIIVLIGWIASRIGNTDDDSLKEYFAIGMETLCFLGLAIAVGGLMYVIGDYIRHLWI